MIDGLDGFELTPSQAATTRLRIVMIALGASTALVVILFGILAVATQERIWWLAVLIYVLLSLPADWILWRVLQPPVLKADGTAVTHKSGFTTISVPRSELAGIHVGQAPRRPGHTSSVRSYVFSTAQGAVLFTVPAIWFRIEDMRAFADRLTVPLSERP